MVSLIFLFWFLALNLIDFCCNFYYFFSFIYFRFNFLSPSSILRWKLRWLILDLSSFIVLNAINFPLTTAFMVSHKLSSFSFNLKYFKISLEILSFTHVLFRTTLVNFQVFWIFFPAIFLLLIFSLIPLCSESRHCMIPILLNLLRICNGLFYGPECGLSWWMFHMSLRRLCLLLLLDEAECSSLQMTLISLWLMILPSSTMSLLILCLLDLSIPDRGVLKLPTITVDSSIFSCSSIRLCLMHFDNVNSVTSCWRTASFIIL